jgi:O-antigen ligase
LIGSCLVFTAIPGAIGDFMVLGGTIFALNVLVGNYRLQELTAGHLAVLGIVSLLVLLSVVVPGAKVHDRSLRYLLLAPGMIMACHALANPLGDLRLNLRTAVTAAVLCTCVTLQTIGWWLHRPGSLFGFYDNPHHLGLFASLALPLLGWVMLRLGGWLCAVMLPWVTAALYLLWQSGSRISWLVFFAAILLASFLFLRRKQIVGVILGVGALAASSAWLSGFSAIGSRISDLWVNFWSEERILLWPATLEALKQNTLGEWLLGHGIGSFRFDFKEYFADNKTLRPYAFPHNAVLQLVFENGIVGTLLVFAGFGSLMWALLRSTRGLPKTDDRYLAPTLFSLLCIEIGHCLLTKSLYSKYILYSLSLIVGVSLVVIEKSRSRIRPQPGTVDPAGVSRADSPKLERELSGRPG